MGHPVSWSSFIVLSIKVIVFTILELYNEEAENNGVNHHGFTRDVSIVKPFEETEKNNEETEKNKKKYLRDIVKFIGNFFLWKTQRFIKFCNLETKGLPAFVVIFSVGYSLVSALCYNNLFD